MHPCSVFLDDDDQHQHHLNRISPIMETRLAKNKRFTWVCLLSTGIKGVCAPPHLAPSYFLRQGLSLNMELSISTGVAEQ